MFELQYSRTALGDLDEIWAYIALELLNPDAAVNTVNGIMEAIDRLPDYPLSGTLLNALLDIQSDYRFVIYRSYLAFCHIEGNAVRIDRILHEGRDIVKALFHK